MDSVNPVTSQMHNAAAPRPGSIPTPPPAPPQDPVDGATINFKKASKLVSYKSPESSELVTLWRFDAKHYDSTGFITPEGYFYEGGGSGTLRRFSLGGELLWEKETGHNGLSVAPAVAPDGTAYVSRIVALEAYNPDGSLKWDVPLPDDRNIHANSLSQNIAAGPEGNVYVHDALHLYGVDAKGRVRWTKKMQTWHSNRPVVGPDGTVHTVEKNNTIHAYDPTGKLKWKNTCLTRENPGLPDINTPLAIGPDKSVYFGGRRILTDGCEFGLIALDPGGEVKWRIPTESDLSGYEAPSVDQKTGSIYFGAGSKSEEVWAASPDGQVKWKKQVGPILHVTAMPDGRGVVVAIRGGDLHAFDGEGNPLWTFHTGNIFTRPGFDPNGIMYVGSGKTFYAIQTLREYLDKEDGPGAPSSPTISEDEGWIIIGGVKLPIHEKQ